MNDIESLLNLDWTAIILSIFIIMSAFIAMVNIIGKFSEIIKKPVWWAHEQSEFCPLQHIFLPFGCNR